MTKAIRTVLLAAACAAAAWSAALVLFGGFNARVLGIAIRSRNPDRALLIAGLALAGYFLAGGRIQRDTIRRLGSAGSGIVEALVRRPGFIAGALALTLAMTAMVASTRIAGGADAYGYVSQADLWLAGDLVIKQPWVAEVPWPNAEWSFSPLGYRPVEPLGQWAIVPTYSPGLPLLFAGAKLVAGQCALFAVVPLFTGLGVLVTYGIGKRLVSPWGGVMAAWLVAASPIVIGMALEPLTDVPVMTVWTTSIYLLLARPGRFSPALVGMTAGIAILIRPNLVPLSIPFGLWYLIRRQSDGDARVLSIALFALGVLPAILLIAFLNQHLYGSPLSSGYGTLNDLYAWSHVGPNVRRYFAWFTFAQTPIALAGLVALFVPIRRLWTSAADLRIVPILAVFVALLWGQYFAYEVYDSWGFLRFLLPSWPLIMVGLAAVLLAASELWLARLPRVVVRTALGMAVVLLGVWTFSPILRDNVLGGREAAALEAPLGQLVRKHTVDNSVVLVWERSGTIRYYSGRTTLRYDYLDREWLDRAVAWLRERGVHVYAVLDPNHVEQCRRRFAGQATLAALDRPVFLYEPARSALYDLTTPRPPEQSLILYEKDPGGRPPCDPPVESTPISLRGNR